MLSKYIIYSDNLTTLTERLHNWIKEHDRCYIHDIVFGKENDLDIDIVSIYYDDFNSDDDIPF